MADRTGTATRRAALVALLETAPLISASALAVLTNGDMHAVTADLAALAKAGRVRKVVAAPADRGQLDAVAPRWVWMVPPVRRSLAEALRDRAHELAAEREVVDVARAMLDATPSVLEVSP